jgi:branched-chain amino acid aminotransferase
VKSRDSRWDVGEGEPGPVTMKLRELLTGIHHGTVTDERDWMYPLA